MPKRKTIFMLLLLILLPGMQLTTVVGSGPKNPKIGKNISYSIDFDSTFGSSTVFENQICRVKIIAVENNLIELNYTLGVETGSASCSSAYVLYILPFDNLDVVSVMPNASEILLPVLFLSGVWESLELLFPELAQTGVNSLQAINHQRYKFKGQFRNVHVFKGHIELTVLGEDLWGDFSAIYSNNYGMLLKYDLRIVGSTTGDILDMSAIVVDSDIPLGVSWYFFVLLLVILLIVAAVAFTAFMAARFFILRAKLETAMSQENKGESGI